MFEYPFFIGLYDVSKSKMITVFLYDNEGDRSPWFNFELMCTNNH